MQVIIPLDKMTVAEKLQALDDIWSDLQKTAEEDIPSPAWHANVLKSRTDRAQDGKSNFIDWPDARAPRVVYFLPLTDNL